MHKAESKPKSDEPLEELQAELVRFQRQFRLLEDDRRAYKDETEYMLKKQQDNIKSLNTEYEELMKETRLAGSVKNQNEDRKNISTLKNLLEDESKVKNELQIHDKKLKHVNRKISDLKATTDRFRKNIMGDCQSSELRCKAIIKLRSVMENRLNEGNVKLNMALGENVELREEIDHINEQRKRFVELQNKLSKILRAVKKEKDLLIQKSTLLFNSRDEAHHRMHSLRERSERDINSFSSELKDLLRVIDHDKKLREFMRTKMEERQEIYETTVKGRKKKKLLDYTKGLQVEVEHYESIFDDLHEVSGISDIDEMVQMFIRIEDGNFTLFNFVKEQSQQVQQKEVAVENLKQQIEKIQKEDVQVEKQQKEILGQLEATEQHHMEQRQKLFAQIKQEDELLEKVCVKINGMLDRAKCKRSSMVELLGGSKISTLNMLSYLGLIEQRTAEMIQAKSLLQMRKGDEQIAQEPHKNILSLATVGRIAKYCIGLPSLSTYLPEYNTTLSDFVRPISQTEARAMISKMKKSKGNLATIASKVDFPPGDSDSSKPPQQQATPTVNHLNSKPPQQ